jgi:hypothetical protein
MRAIPTSIFLLRSGLSLTLGCGAADLSLPSDGRAVELRVKSGDNQRATVGDSLPRPLVVEVSDGAGNPVRDVTLVFRFLDEFPNAEIQPPVVRSDSTGEASVRVRLGSTAGSQTVEATMAEATPNVRALFGVTALEDRGRDGGGGDGKDKKKKKDKE